MQALIDLQAQDGLAALLKADLGKDLLRFTTAGSVDDGKSTLIGRLLHDAKGVYEDQVASVQKSKINRSGGAFDFSLLTDGLRAEREQGITIDVAYRYFSTARRKFIIADTPGHEQYTRNMATGASTADLAVILVDATKGLLTQTRRHAYIGALLGIRSVVAAINKMDLVDYREEVFVHLQEDFLSLASHLGIPFVRCIPISALAGVNVVSPSEAMPWYPGPTLLEHLETVELHPEGALDAVRFPVQYVIRPDSRFRGFAGQLASGSLHVGDAVVALPSGQATRLKAIVGYDGDARQAVSPQSLTLQLENEIDLSRGDMLVSPDQVPAVAKNFTATLVWLHEEALFPRRPLLLKQTTRLVRARVRRILRRVDVNTLEQEPAERLELNGIAEVEVETSQPLFLDPYTLSRATGSFILIDPLSNATVGAGMVREPQLAHDSGTEDGKLAAADASHDEIWLQERFRRHGHKPGIFLLGNRRALARSIERRLFEDGFEVMVLGASDIPFGTLRALLASLHAAGLLVLCTNASFKPEDFDTVRFGGVFHADAANHREKDDRQLTQEVLAFAQSLRLPGDPEPQEGKS